MNAHPTSHPAQQKSAVVRARCDDELKNLVTRAASRLGLDEADIIRMGARDFASRVLLQKVEFPYVSAAAA